MSVSGHANHSAGRATSQVSAIALPGRVPTVPQRIGMRWDPYGQAVPVRSQIAPVALPAIAGIIKMSVGRKLDRHAEVACRLRIPTLAFPAVAGCVQESVRWNLHRDAVVCLLHVPAPALPARTKRTVQCVRMVRNPQSSASRALLLVATIACPSHVRDVGVLGREHDNAVIANPFETTVAVPVGSQRIQVGMRRHAEDCTGMCQPDLPVSEVAAVACVEVQVPSRRVNSASSEHVRAQTDRHAQRQCEAATTEYPRHVQNPLPASAPVAATAVPAGDAGLTGNRAWSARENGGRDFDRAWHASSNVPTLSPMAGSSVSFI